jgi:hypothetical protein
MSMDEMLLNELYGSEETRQDEEIKQAQVELVEAVAAEAGVDLNELDDDELAKFAHYVLSDEDEVAYSDDTQQDKLAEADMVGRQMAHSYMDELNQLNGDDMSDYTQEKIASAMDDVAEAWFMQKVAAEGDESTPKAKPEGPGFFRRGYNAAMGHDAAGKGGGFKKLVGLEEIANDQGMLRRVGRGAGALGVAGGAGYGLYRGAKALMGRGESEKKASLFLDAGYEALALAELVEPEEFAKEAEFRAAEILVANGIDPTDFSECYPENVKIASFPGVEYASDEYEAAALEEYNDMLDAAALHIIDSL